MYNEELKTRFIADYANEKSTYRATTRILRRLEKYEKQWGADFCTKSTEELRPVVDEVTGMRYESTVVVLSILREYVKWCINNGVPGACDGMLSIRVAGIGNIKKRMVASPLHLKTYLDTILHPVDEGTIDNTYRCFFWMIYAGVDENYVMSISKRNIDLKNREIRCGSNYYPIYPEALDSFESVVKLKKFKYIHPNYKKEEPTYKERIPGNSILRGVSSDKVLVKLKEQITARITRAIADGKTELRLSSNRAALSGIFYRLYDRERAGLPISFTEFATMRVAKNTPDVFKDKKETDKRIKKAERDLENDYARWKLAFSSWE